MTINGYFIACVFTFKLTKLLSLQSCIDSNKSRNHTTLNKHLKIPSFVRFEPRAFAPNRGIFNALNYTSTKQLNFLNVRSSYKFVSSQRLVRHRLLFACNYYGARLDTEMKMEITIKNKMKI